MDNDLTPYLDSSLSPAKMRTLFMSLIQYNQVILSLMKEKQCMFCLFIIIIA